MRNKVHVKENGPRDQVLDLSSSCEGTQSKPAVLSSSSKTNQDAWKLTKEDGNRSSNTKEEKSVAPPAIQELLRVKIDCDALFCFF